MSTSSLVQIFALITVVFAIGMAVSANKEKIGLSLLFGVGTLFFGFATCVGTFDLGHGHVPILRMSVLSERLETGTAYQLLASSKDEDGNLVALIKKTGASNFYALRMKDAPPEHFTLVDGKPVAIVAPAPPVGVK